MNTRPMPAAALVLRLRDNATRIDYWDPDAYRAAADEIERLSATADQEDYANPVSQVFFRAGLLVCRETMARFVEQGGHPEIAQSIRANWWPSLGADPGAPRKLHFDEVAAEREGGGYDISPALTASIEALPVALAFMDARERGES